MQTTKQPLTPSPWEMCEHPKELKDAKVVSPSCFIMFSTGAWMKTADHHPPSRIAQVHLPPWEWWCCRWINPARTDESRVLFHQVGKCAIFYSDQLKQSKNSLHSHGKGKISYFKFFFRVLLTCFCSVRIQIWEICTHRASLGFATWITFWDLGQWAKRGWQTRRLAKTHAFQRVREKSAPWIFKELPNISITVTSTVFQEYKDITSKLKAKWLKFCVFYHKEGNRRPRRMFWV